MIETLIEERDNVEVLRDEIAAILRLELDNQKQLAEAADKDPTPWDVRVFMERSNPWSEYQHAPSPDEARPIVNVYLDTTSYDPSKSNPIARQHATATFNIDCYGYGVSEDDPHGGHVLGDQRAALEAQRARRLVRRILMSAHYRYLRHQGLVWDRRFRSETMFQQLLENRAVQRIAACRMAFEVSFNEFSPQVQGQPLELISVEMKHADTGEVYFTGHWDYS